MLKQGFKSAQERKFYEDKFVCLLGTLGPNNGLNHMAQLGSYAKEMYSMYTDFLGSHQRHYNNSNVNQRASASGLARAGMH